VSLTVSPAINQAPSFTAGPSQTDEDAGAQTVAGWATAPKPPPNGWSAKGATNSPNTFDALMGLRHRQERLEGRLSAAHGL